MFVSASDYDQFMGRYSKPLAKEFAGFAGVERGLAALDVGCGPGALTDELVRRLGPDSVHAIDPSREFVAALQNRHPKVVAQVSRAESIPYPADAFDMVLAQLVVHFMSDPTLGLAEMRRVTRSGGSVAACVWDLARDMTPLTLFWEAAVGLNPTIETEVSMPGVRENDLRDLFAAAGLEDIRAGTIEVEVTHENFEEWWYPFTLGVGPAGAYVASLSPDERASLEQATRERVPEGQFTLTSRAWAVLGRP